LFYHLQKYIKIYIACRCCFSCTSISSAETFAFRQSDTTGTSSTFPAWKLREWNLGLNHELQHGWHWL